MSEHMRGLATKAIHAGFAPDPATGAVNAPIYASSTFAQDGVGGLRAVLRPGDHVVMPDDAYGGTFRLIDKVFTEWGISYTAVALSDLHAVQAAVTSQTR